MRSDLFYFLYLEREREEAFYICGVQYGRVRNDRVLLEYFDRVRQYGIDGLGCQLVEDAVRVLLHVAIANVDHKVLFEFAGKFGRAIDGDHLVSVLKNDAHCWRDCVHAELKSALILTRLSVFFFKLLFQLN